MSWFQLDASTVACRVRAEGDADAVPSFPGSVMRGAFGFTVVSVAGFVPWAVFGPWFLRHFGEGGMYGVSALVFVLLSGLLLHRLIIGPGSLLIFYKLFSLVFAAYAVAWMMGWMALGGDEGSLAGLGAGALVMGLMLVRAFEVGRLWWAVIPVLFLGSSAGYFGGQFLEPVIGALPWPGIAPEWRGVMERLAWGVCFGLGFGAGLGAAFFLCQRDVRAFLRELEKAGK